MKLLHISNLTVTWPAPVSMIYSKSQQTSQLFSSDLMKTCLSCTVTIHTSLSFTYLKRKKLLMTCCCCIEAYFLVLAERICFELKKKDRKLYKVVLVLFFIGHSSSLCHHYFLWVYVTRSESFIWLFGASRQSGAGPYYVLWFMEVKCFIQVEVRWQSVLCTEKWTANPYWP